MSSLVYLYACVCICEHEFRKWCIFKATTIFVLFILWGYKSYGGFLEGCTVSHYEIRPEYLLSTEISTNKLSLYNLLLRLLVEYFIAWIYILQSVAFQINVCLFISSLFSSIIHFCTK